MNTHNLKSKLAEWLKLSVETEWLEFKEAKTSFDLDALGRYFSALSNEANLKGKEAGWLIFGVSDKLPRQIVGTEYKKDAPSREALKKMVADQTGNHLTFKEIHEVHHSDGRVLIFEIPAALRGVPTAWKGHYYGRDGESIGALNLVELEQIRRQSLREDWSARVCEAATLEHLDQKAISFAREQFKQKHSDLAKEIDGWDDKTFLNKAKICLDGRITNTALLLLGIPESAALLSPALARITWVLKDAAGVEKDYVHLGAPFIFAVNDLFSRIRNLTVRHLPSGTLFPHEVMQYDPWVIRETLHNCIAHQDYTLSGRINVVEDPETLLFTNVGSFIPGTVEKMIESDAPPEIYRNPFLAQAMVNLNMIDTIGSGIKKMFMVQRQRNFPMPDYELGVPDKVVVRLTGRILDENYTRLLMSRTEIDLMDVIALDKVQKKRLLNDEEFKRLKAKELIEGRRPNLFVSANIADATEEKVEYIKNRAFDKAHYREMLLSYLEKFKEASRPECDRLLMNKLSDALNEAQKKRFITNLLQEMKKDGLIEPHGITRWAKWRMSKNGFK
jgi:ATP-dependent DNA helicase RecG